MTETQEIQLFKFDAEFAFEQPLDDLVLVMTMTSKMGRPIRQPIPMLGKIPSLEVAWKKAMPYIQKWIMGANSTGNVEVIYDELELQAKLSQAIDKIDIVAFERTID